MSDPKMELLESAIDKLKGKRKRTKTEEEVEQETTTRFKVKPPKPPREKKEEPEPDWWHKAEPKTPRKAKGFRTEYILKPAVKAANKGSGEYFALCRMAKLIADEIKSRGDDGALDGLFKKAQEIKNQIKEGMVLTGLTKERDELIRYLKAREYKVSDSKAKNYITYCLKMEECAKLVASNCYESREVYS